MRPLCIAPSILAADFAKLGEEVRAIDAGRRRLDPSRRDGRALRAEHLLRARRDCGDAPAFQEDVRHAPDDRALRSVPRSLRQGRLRHHHGARGGRSARAPLAAGDPRARQEGRRHAQSRHAGRDAGERDRPRRSGPGDVGEPRLRRAGLHPGRAGEDRARARAGRRRARSTSRSTAASRRRTPTRSPAPAPTCWSRAPPCSRAASRLREKYQCDPHRGDAGEAA